MAFPQKLPTRVTQGILDAAQAQFSLWTDEVKGQAPTWHLRWLTDIPATSLALIYSFITRLTRAQEWLDERHVGNLERRVMMFKLRTYDSGVAVSREDLLYPGQLASLRPEIQNLPEDKDRLTADEVIDILNNGHGTDAKYVGYDDKPFFSAAHPGRRDVNGKLTAISQRNYQASLALTEANALAIEAEMMAYCGDNGRILGVKPNVLHFASDLKSTALNLVDKQNLAGGESNVCYKRWELEEHPEYATGIWGLADLSKRTKPMAHAHAIETDPRWITTPGDKNKTGIYGFDFDQLVFPSMWPYVYKCVKP